MPYKLQLRVLICRSSVFIGVIRRSKSNWMALLSGQKPGTTFAVKRGRIWLAWVERMPPQHQTWIRQALVLRWQLKEGKILPLMGEQLWERQAVCKPRKPNENRSHARFLRSEEHLMLTEAFFRFGKRPPFSFPSIARRGPALIVSAMPS